MNNKQKLYCCISGYEPQEPYTSARDDYYYEMIEKKFSYKDRINHLQAYALEYVGDMTAIECGEVDEALRNQTDNQNDDYYNYSNLGED
jgi:hypothetical protein